jgi:phosphatidylinositol alpha-1,6-mannosyltransferase
MRFGIVAPEFPPDIGGVETYSYEFSAELARRGHQVTVFTHPHIVPGECPPGVTVIPELHQQRAADWQFLKKFSLDAWHVMNASYAWLALQNPQVVISVHGNDFISPYFLPQAQPWPNAFGLWRLDARFASLRRRLRRKSAWREMHRGLARARHVIANSEYTKNLLIQHVPRCAANSSVGYVGVGSEFLRMPCRDRYANKCKKLVTVCRLNEPRKNVDKILHALGQLKRHSFEFVVVGDGPMRPQLEALSVQLKLSDRVKFAGFISKSEILELLASSDLFILTSEVMAKSIEGFGIAYLEANACGTPVLAARSAGAAEAVDEGKTGFFVEVPSVPAITIALERFLNNEVNFRSEDCKEFASRFTWARVVDQASKYYNFSA